MKREFKTADKVETLPSGREMIVFLNGELFAYGRVCGYRDFEIDILEEKKPYMKLLNYFVDGRDGKRYAHWCDTETCEKFMCKLDLDP